MSGRDFGSLQEFDPTTTTPTTSVLALPSNESRVPEAMNNYNLPKDKTAIQQKLRLLTEFFPTFDNKSADDLEDLLQYEDLFHAHVNGLAQIQQTRTLEYGLRIERKAMAEKNLAAESELRELRNKVAELEMVADSLTTSVSGLVQAQADRQRPFAPQVVVQRMGDECRRLDAESEEVLERFRDPMSATYMRDANGMLGSAACEEFVKRFKTIRAKYHALHARHQIAAAAIKNHTMRGIPLMES